MRIRLIGALLCGVGFLCSGIIFAQAAKVGENNSPIPRDRKAQTTVKSDKSNTSDRMGGGGGKGSAQGRVTGTSVDPSDTLGNSQRKSSTGGAARGTGGPVGGATGMRR